MNGSSCGFCVGSGVDSGGILAWIMGRILGRGRTLGWGQTLGWERAQAGADSGALADLGEETPDSRAAG